MDAAPPANTSNCNQSIPSCFKDQSSWAIVRTVKDWNAFIKWMSYRIKYRWIVSKPLVTQQRFGCCCRTVSGHSFIRLFFSSPCFVLLKYNDGPLMTSWQNYLCQELPTAGCLQIPPDANHFKMKHCHISHISSVSHWQIKGHHQKYKLVETLGRWKPVHDGRKLLNATSVYDFICWLLNKIKEAIWLCSRNHFRLQLESDL